MEENKEILELLKQIEKSNRQQARSGKWMCLFAMITALCCVVMFVLIFQILPQINTILPQINTVVTQMQNVLGNLEEATGQLVAMDLESMIADVDTLVITGQQSLEQTMEKLNTIDFETLNQAIKDLAAVVEPLNKLISVFR